MINVYQHEINAALEFLSKSSGVIVVPTDTTYGVICGLDRPEAIERIYTIKGRDKSKPLIILGSSLDKLMSWVAGDTTLIRGLASRFWPGPLTIVVPANINVPRSILSGGTTVGLRMPDHEATLSVLSQMANRSVASTSANLSGAGSPKTTVDVMSSIGQLVDYVMPDCGQKPLGTVSTIIDLSGKDPSILREGALPASAVLKVALG